MTPTPIFKDHTGKWREVNPFEKYQTNVLGDSTWKHTAEYNDFEQSITYHEFPSAPSVKPGEVVEAYLQWQSKPKEDNFEWEGDRDWQTLPIEDNTEVDMEDYTGFDDFTDHVSWGFITRQIWVAANQSTSEEQPKEMAIVKKVRTLVEDTTDYVGDFFGAIHKQYDGEKAYEVKDFKNSDTRLSLLKIDDKTVAMVIENRTEFNHCEYIFCQDQSPSAPKVEESDFKLTAEDIVAQMREEMVFKISDVTVPYIVEAIEQYATLKTSQLQSELNGLLILQDQLSATYNDMVSQLDGKEKEIEGLGQQLDEYKSSLKALVQEVIEQTKKY